MKKFSEFKNSVAEKQELSKKQEEYRKFFQEKLTKFNVSSPAELDEEGKKKFFNEVQTDWKG